MTPTYGKRPRRHLPPPLAGGGKASDAEQPKTWGRGILRARQLRAQASEAEQKLWRALRQKQFGGLRFRRQFPLGPYFADFVCLPARLVVEVDGSQHGEDARAAHDARRTQWLNQNNFRVIRFSTYDVMAQVETVLEGIAAVLRLPLPQARRGAAVLPPPARGGGI